jgi:peptidoglycan hydrolase CwlO-like protein
VPDFLPTDADHVRAGMHTRFFIVAVCSCVVISGCTLAKLQQESGEMETRIDQKEQDLKQIENRQTVLLSERKKLLSELDNKQVTLNELYSGLDRLRKENARLKVDNERQQKEKQRVESEIQKFQAEISRLNSDDRLPDKVKKERIESLKKQIKTYLELMLTQ